MTLAAPVPRLVDQFERGLDAPICLTWELTYACNLSCVHCLSSSGKRDPRELSTQQCKDIIDELERMQVFYVNIGGGEPTIRAIVHRFYEGVATDPLLRSAAIALESATRSWLARESLRTRRPNHMVGSTTSTRMPSTCVITQGLVTMRASSAPAPISVLRRPSDRLEPTTVCTSVVSVVRRLSTSPVRVLSKNSGLCRTTCA